MVTLTVKAISWGFMLAMIGVETKVYIREFRWYVRFGILYVLVAEAVMLNFVISLEHFYMRSVSLAFMQATTDYQCANFVIFLFFSKQYICIYITHT